MVGEEDYLNFAGAKSKFVIVVPVEYLRNNYLQGCFSNSFFKDDCDESETSSAGMTIFMCTGRMRHTRSI